MTREQEFKVLEQIKAILDSLPEDSYVKAGFKGCCEIAEDNICDDTLLTPEDRYTMRGRLQVFKYYFNPKAEFGKILIEYFREKGYLDEDE